MFADGVMESSSTLGTADYVLTGSRFNGLQFNAKFVNNQAVAVVSQTLNRSKYEIIVGTFLTGPSRITRTTVLSSSQGGSKVNWQAGDVYYISSFASADALAGMLSGNLATSRPWWVRNGGRWLDYTAGIGVSWIDKFVKDTGADLRVGLFDVVKGLYFADNRVPSTSVGAADKSFTAADIGGAFTFNTSAAARTATLPTAAMAVGDGYSLQLNTTDSQYGLTLTPDATHSIDYLGAGVSKVVPGGKNVRIRWDASVSQWFTDFLGPDETTVASAATVNLALVRSMNVVISGTTGITSFGNVTRGAIRFVRFSGALSLTHSAGLDLCNGGQNIATAAGDTAIFFANSNNNWKCINYQRYSGQALMPSKGHYALNTASAGAIASAASSPMQITEGIQLFSTTFTGDAGATVIVEVDLRDCVGQNVAQYLSLFYNGGVNSVATSTIQFTNTATHKQMNRVVYGYVSDGSAKAIQARVAGNGSIGASTMVIRQIFV